MMDVYNPRVVVVGAGALGGLFGALLKEGGLDVTLVDIWQEHVDAINRNGLRLVGHGGERAIPIRATTEHAEAGVADVVIVLCKAVDTVAATTSARPLFGDGSVAISFQNGLGNEEAIGGIVGEDRVLGGLTAQGSSIEAPGVVRNYSDLPSYIGEMPGGLSERAERIAGAFTRAGLQTTASADIRRDIWRKLMANTSASTASAAVGLPIGEAVAIPEIKRLVFGVVEEAVPVAQAAGIDLDPEEARAILLQITGKGGT